MLNLSTNTAANKTLSLLQKSFSASSKSNCTKTCSSSSTPISEVTAQKLLKKPPFAPTNVNLFTPQVYSSATATVPAAANNVTTAQLKSQLGSTLLKRLNGDSWTTQQTVNKMDDAALTQTVPNPRLRAALLSLKGTVGQASIDTITSGTFQSIQFGTTPSGANTIAEVVAPAAGQTKPSIVINSKYQYEDFRVLGSILSHETLHQDPANGGKEELINNIIDSTTYGEALLTNPELATNGTELTRRLNTKLMARVNSRDASGALRITTAQSNVYPNGTALANFGAAFNTSGADTTGNAAMRKAIQLMTGQAASNANFNTATINLLDTNQKAFSASEVVQLAKTLKLNVPNG
jgi:hypothetical protein